MIAEDLDVLLRLRRVNQNLGSAVVQVLDHQGAAGIEPMALRALADGLDAVVAELRALAATRENTVDSPP